jgi:hypothetical protein
LQFFIAVAGPSLFSAFLGGTSLVGDAFLTVGAGA